MEETKSTLRLSMGKFVCMIVKGGCPFSKVYYLGNLSKLGF
jgi:hypothetical protein